LDPKVDGAAVEAIQRAVKHNQMSDVILISVAVCCYFFGSL